ncbi:hypothetical protein JTB14_005616 [Gonioctena quinquepunctata]|nr:hypothetical protein JTB14_005616 [Gonioctena quinquepunctata]
MSIPRRSERKTKGIPPERYEDAPDNLKQATESRKSTHPSCTHDKSISRVESKITKSSNSRRKLLEIEIEEARKLAEIERRKAEIDAEMIIKEAQLRREIIQEGSSKKSTISGAENQDDHIERINFFQEESPTILLRIIPVKLRGRKKEISTFALLEAATTTMIDSRIAQEIGLDGPLEPLCYQWLNNVSKSEENSRKVSLEISGIEENSKKYRIKDVRTVNGLSLPKQTLDVKKMSESYPYIKETPANLSEFLECTICFENTIRLGSTW